MKRPTPRFARVLHTVTIAFDLDLEARRILQILVDHTAPLRTFDFTSEEESELTPDDEKAALGLIATCADPWPRWALFGEEPFRLPRDPEALPPFDET